MDLLGLDYARGLEQGADNKPSLVPAVDVAGVCLHPAARRVIVLVAVLPTHWLRGVERCHKGVGPSAHLVGGNAAASGIDASHGGDGRSDRRRCLGGLDNGGRGNGQWCGHANRYSWAAAAGGGAGSSRSRSAMRNVTAHASVCRIRFWFSWHTEIFPAEIR